MVHVERGGIAPGPSDDFSGNTCGGAVRRHIPQNDTAGPDLGTFTNFDIAEDLCSGPDEDTATHFGMSITAGLAGTTECDFVEHGDIIFDDGGFSDDDGRSMVDENSGADAGSRMDIDSEGF